MADVLILEFSGVDAGDYDAVNRQLGIDPRTGAGDWPPGLLSHAAGTAEAGRFVVVEVWASQAEQAAFMEGRLRAAMAAAGLTAIPAIRWIPLVAYHTPGA